MRRSYAHLFLSVCLALALFAIPVFPQSAVTGNIAGRAQDSSGALFPGVEVTITSPAMIGGARTEVTDETGSYRFTLLPAGIYSVKFALNGFKTKTVTEVEVTPNATMTINGSMEVASVAEEITVSSQQPAIDLEATTVGVNWDIHKLDELPSARSLMSLNATIPGVYFAASATNPFDVGGSQFGTGSAVTGRTFGRSSNNVMAIDGLVWCQGYADYGSFEEVNLTTASKGADQANAGLTMEMVVKSGSNQFHGNFTQSYERGAWHPFGQSTNVDADLLARGFSAGSNKFVYNRQTYGDIGGYIKKDKLWFYFAYSDGQLNQNMPGYIDFSNGQSAVFLSKLQNPTAKLTYQLNSKMKLETSWPLNLKTQPYRNASNRIPLQATQNQHAWATYGPNLKWTYIVSPKMTATAAINRGGYWWPDVPWSGDTNATLSNLPVTSTGIPTLANANDVRRIDTVTTATLGPQLAIYRRPIRWTWTGDVARFQTIHGKNNEFKIGYTDWWTKNYITNFGYPNQQVYRYQSLSAEDYTNGGNVVTPAGILQVFQHPNSVQISNYPNTTVSAFGYKAFYINDKINLSRKLTLTVGLRMDYFNSWLPTQGQKGLGPLGYIPDGKNSPPAPDFTAAINYPEIKPSAFPSYWRFDPRLSVAYDLRGDGKIALRASYGRYTAYSSGISSSLNDASNVGPNSSTSTCTYTGWKGDIPFRPLAGNYTSVSCTGGLQTLPGQVGPNGVAFSVSDPTTWPKRFGTGLDPDYLDEWTAGVDIGLSRNYVIRATVVRKFDYVREKALDLAQPMSSYTDERCYNYNAANNAVVPAASNNLMPSGDMNSGVACVWSVPASFAGQGKVNQLYAALRPGEGKSQYTAYEVVFNKQLSNGWSLLASYDLAMQHLNPVDPLNPNEVYYHYDNRGLATTGNSSGTGETGYAPTAWDHGIKLAGIATLPWGLQWANTFDVQSGAWFNRGVQVKNAQNVNVTQTIAYNVGRYPWVKLWSQRLVKRFKIGERQTMEASWELFNVLNINDVTSQGTTIGTSTFYGNNGTLYKPSAIVSPRVSQIGVRYRF